MTMEQDNNDTAPEYTNTRKRLVNPRVFSDFTRMPASPPPVNRLLCRAMPCRAVPAASTRSVGLGAVSMSSRLRESDDNGGKKAKSHWKPGDYKKRSSEAIVGEVGRLSLCTLVTCNGVKLKLLT